MRNKLIILIDKLPLGLNKFVVSLYRSINSFKEFLLSLLHMRMIKNEASRLKNLSSLNESSRFYIVYDNNISPPAYGDFMNMAMLARWFAINNFHSHFIIIKHQPNYDNWSELTTKSREAFLDFQTNWVKAFEPVGIHLNLFEWSVFLEWVQKKDHNEIIVFESDVLKKNMIVRYAFNLLNVLTRGASDNTLMKWRLNETTISKTNIHVTKPYIAWNIRKSNILPELNNSELQIVEAYRFLKYNFPDHKILILSDNSGTNFAKEIASRYDLKIMFSKDIPGNSTYIDDANLILRSDFYFQFGGGGMSTIAFFSNIPYLIFQKPSYEKETFRLGLNWSKTDQKFICLNHWSPINIEYILTHYNQLSY